MQPFLVLPMIISTTWADTLPLGALVAFAGQNVPAGFELCDGGVSQFPGLAPVFNGVRPNMISRVALGAGSGIGLTPRNTGDTGGVASTGVSVSQLPPHSHSMRMASPIATTLSADPKASFVTQELLTTTGTNVSMDVSMVQVSGLNALEHNNLGPSITTQWIVAVAKVAPPAGAMVYYARDLTVSVPGEIRAIGQNLTSARADLVALGLTVAPDTRDAFLMGNPLTGIDGPNTRLGEEVHFLTPEELPGHTHTFSALTGTRDLTPPTPSSRLGDSDTFDVYAPPSAGQLTVMAVGAIVLNRTAAHENMHPFLVMDVILFTGEVCDATTLPGSVCNCDLLTGACTLGTTGSAPIVISGDATFPGNVTLTPSSTVVVNVAGGASLTVNGTVTVNGALTILASGPGTTTVITAGSIVGHFSSVTVVLANNCSQVTGTGVYTSTTLSVTVSVPPCDGAGNNGLSTGVIVGIVVGIVGAAIVVAIAGMLIHRHRSNAAMYRAKHQIENQQKFSAMKASSL
jgi:microcystin-dependent protein